MNKKYEIKPPVSKKVQVVGLLIILIVQTIVLSMTKSDYFILHLLLSILIIVIVIQIVLNLRSAQQIELTNEGIITKNIHLPIERISEIIIDGYFIQSIGIKQVGHKFVSYYLHFRFKEDEEKNIKTLKDWAEKNGIPVVAKKIRRLI